MRQVKHSQNFVKNQDLLESLIKSSSICDDDLVFDLGAGDGKITEALRKHCKEVVAIEKDKKLYNELQNRFKLASNVKVVNKDILKYKFPADKNYKIFSNIPFNYTADIIRKLSEQKHLADDIYLFAQKQATLNYLGSPKVKESLKSLFIKSKFKPSLVHRFRRNDFKPSPRVEVVLLRLEKLANPLVSNDDDIEWKNFVVYGFSQFKPTLKESFKHVFTDKQFRRLSKDLNFDIKSQPTHLSAKQWLGLYNFFRDNIKVDKKSLIRDSYQSLMRQQDGLNKIYRTRTDKEWRKNSPK